MKNEIEIWLLAGVAMARKGAIVAASGMSQKSNGEIMKSQFGCAPGLAPPGGNVTPLFQRKVRNDIAKRWLYLARLAKTGDLIGVAGVIIFSDGGYDIVALGSLSGVKPMIAAINFR